MSRWDDVRGMFMRGLIFEYEVSTSSVLAARPMLLGHPCILDVGFLAKKSHALINTLAN
jgi:hypothetical protein